jgi:hypothetical protein
MKVIFNNTFWEEDDAPESGDSDGDLIPPMDGDDSDGADEKAGDPTEC